MLSLGVVSTFPIEAATHLCAAMTMYAPLEFLSSVMLGAKAFTFCGGTRTAKAPDLTLSASVAAAVIAALVLTSPSAKSWTIAPIKMTRQHASVVFVRTVVFLVLRFRRSLLVARTCVTTAV